MQRYGGTVIYESSDEMGPLEIIEDGFTRSLHFGSEPKQSSMDLNDPYRLTLLYSRAMVTSLLFHATPRRALLIGLGGGSCIDAAKGVAILSGNGGRILHFEGVNSISEAEQLAGLIVAIPIEDRAPLAEDVRRLRDEVGELRSQLGSLRERLEQMEATRAMPARRTPAPKKPKRKRR